MARIAHPRSAELLSWLNRRKQSAKPLAGEYYRVAGPRHTTAGEIVSGVGAFIAGGRWNPIGEMKVVYLSKEPETALRESLASFRYHNLPISDALPKITVAVAVKLERVLNLSKHATVTEFLGEDWRALMARGVEAGSQALGWAAFAAGLQGLIVPSKPDPTGVNLIVFPENLTRRCRLEVMNAAELDKLGKRA
jgi:RES domain-containing protein